MSPFQSFRGTARCVAVAAVVGLTVLAGCGRDRSSAEPSAADQLEKLVAEQRAQPAQTPAVPDRKGVEPVLTERWRWTSPDGGNMGLPATDARGVVVTHTERYLAALDDTGALEWSFEHAGLRPVEPLLVGDLVVAAAEDDVLAIDRDTGALRWRAPIGHERANAPTLGGDATVLVTTWEGRLLALDLRSGVVRWSVTLEGRSLWRPAAADGFVVAAWDAGWGGFDLADGRARWSAELWPEGTGSPVVVSPAEGSAVAVIASGGRIDANQIDTGKELWRTTIWVDTSIDQGVTALAARPTTVAVPDRDGGITVLDAASGEVQWFREGTEGDLAERGSPTPIGDGLLAYPLDVGGVRLAWAGGDVDFDPGGLVAGAARLGERLVLTTWQSERPSVVAFDVLT